MSVAGENSRLESARDTIRQKMVSAGLAEGNEKLDVLASLLRFDGGGGGGMNRIFTPLLGNSSNLLYGIIINHGNYCTVKQFATKAATSNTRARVFPKVKDGTKPILKTLSVSSNALSIAVSNSSLETIDLSKVYDDIMYVPDMDSEDETVLLNNAVTLRIKASGEIVFSIPSGTIIKSSGVGTGVIFPSFFGHEIYRYITKGTKQMHVSDPNGRTMDLVLRPTSGSGQELCFDIVRDSGEGEFFGSTSFSLTEDFSDTVYFFNGG